MGPHALGCHAFVCRAPDENHEAVYRWLLQKNLRMYAVSFAVDRLGDIYLDARLPLSSVTPDELDRLLGSVLTYADESFNTILELGFASSIRKEWEWRNLRGESTANLEAFRGWLETGADPSVGDEHRDEGEGGREGLHEQDAAADGRGAVQAGDDHADQEETRTPTLSATSPQTRPATRKPL